MVSTKQKEANVQNALLSTGPVTPNGDAIVARNAVKHGIFTNDPVINTGDGREDEFEYHKLFAELQEDLSPVGRMERMLVEKIAINYWRLRRLIRYESDEIRSRLDNFRENAVDVFYNSAFDSRPKSVLEYHSYNDEISDTKYQAQL